MDNENNGAPEEISPFTPDKIDALLFTAEYLIARIKDTPKESIMDMGCPESNDDPDLIPMPFVECRMFKFLEDFIAESRCLWNRCYPNKKL